MKPDPELAWYGHPVLPAGCNSWDMNGDDYDGSGVNEPIWPMLFDTFEGYQVLIITPEMLDAFNNLCSDFALACDIWQESASPSDNIYVSGPEWATQIVLPQPCTYKAPWMRNKVAPAPDWRDVHPVSASWQLSPQAEANTTFMDQDWGTYVVPAKPDTGVLPAQPDEANIINDWPDEVPAAGSDTVTLAHKPNTQTMRNKT